MRKLFILILTLVSISLYAYEPEFSTAGFFQISNSGREVFSMNPAWRIHKGDIKNAEAVNLNDKDWQVVSLPNGIELLPTEASGCINYQGITWYRKHFTPNKNLKDKKLFLHFEAIMGKSKVFVNGKLMKEHFGGYLPIVIDVTEAFTYDKDNVIAVCTDNSDDPEYAPGKPQDMLDFAYFGGIYRDCWLIAHNEVYITDPNYENFKSNGGLFVSYDNVSEKYADVVLNINIKNDGNTIFKGKSIISITDKNGEEVGNLETSLVIGKGKTNTKDGKIKIRNPKLWSPSSPYLYNLYVKIIDNKGNTKDGYRRKIGIRSIEFKGKDGFWLNGKPYGKPLMGANRHQDYAVVGNAVSNSAHWRDAKKLKDLGMEVIRNAHCPQDPAFMDACDELGLFVIVNTPGWQFWNDKPIFAERVYNDIRNVVRRDRNHPCVWLWEPILNETWYPADFAKKVLDIVNEEYPYPYCYSASDTQAKGSEIFHVQFCHPMDKSIRNPKVTYYTREWGDNVDNWSSHNSPSRTARNWGEQAMLVQAEHYASPYYPYTCFESLCKEDSWHAGGCLWHSFDHQRGYHPDPFYGGIMDVFRQPKYSYYMFKAQRPATKSDLIAETGPMVYIAHEMTPFSGRDVKVFSNCEEVRLTFCKDGKTHIYQKNKRQKGLPSPIITFKNAYDFMIDKELTRNGHEADVFLLAEGLIDGKVVATHKVEPARRAEQIRLRLDNEGMNLRADGSDFVTVIAEITDKNGNVKRLNNYYVKFSIEGEGKIIGGSDVMANPAPVKWGSAPILVQSTTRPGKIKITASVLYKGSQMPVSGEIEINSIASMYPLIFDAKENDDTVKTTSSSVSDSSENDLKIEVEKLRNELNKLKLKEVEQQQTDFGEKEKSNH